jgi:outer membrane protein assembly factor BamB
MKVALQFLLCISCVAVGPYGQADWPVSRGNPLGTAAAPDKLPQEPKLLWEYKTDSVEAGFEGTPVIADGKIIVGDFQGTLHAIDLATGKGLWKAKLKQGVSVPAACGSNRILVGDFDSQIYCFDMEGKEIWSRETEQPMINGAIIRGDEAIYSSDYGSLVCLELETGKEKWVYETGDQLRSSPCIWNNLSFLGGCDSQLHKVDLQTGSAVGESYSLKSPTLSTPNIVGSVAIVPTQPGVVYAIDVEKNETLWSYIPDPSLGIDVQKSSATQARLDAGKLDGIVVMPSRNRRLIALDASNGKFKWEATMRKRSDSAPVLCDQRAWIGSSDGKVYAFQLEDGKESWSYQLSGSILAAPAISNNKLVIATEKGTVACFGE